MYNFIMVKDSELMGVILDGIHVPVRYVKENDISRMVIKTRREFCEEKKHHKRGGIVEICHKCLSPKHFIKDFLLHKMNNQEYLESGYNKRKKEGTSP